MLWLTKGGVDRVVDLVRRVVRESGVAVVEPSVTASLLRGLRCTLQERRGRGKARALLGPLAVRTYRTGVKALSSQSRADERTRAMAFVGSKPVRDERTSAKALSG